MLTILLNWIYVIVITFGLGFGFSQLSGRIFGYQIKGTDSVIMAGLGIATVYAQIFSLFGGVGAVANIVLVAACIIMFCVWSKDITKYLQTCIKECKKQRIVFIVLLVLAWVYFTSRGYIHYDSDLYHGQSIRWIEEYGVVPGLGNLHERFAYNSSFFAVSALFSMKFLLGESMHAMSGFFALLLSITALDIGRSWVNKKFSPADFARVGAIYYLTTIIDEVVSPASDYSIMCVILFIVIKWLDLLEKEEKNCAPYALLCVLGVYGLTLKLTAGLIILLTVKPAISLIKNKKYKEIFIYLGMGLLVAIPWFARTVIISGWLIYPFPALDLFQFDWEMNAAAIEVDAANITTWGRALYNADLVDLPVWEWFPNWYRTTLSGMEKILIAGCILCIFIFIIDFAIIICKKQWERLDISLVIGTVLASYLLWQYSAPLIRYGYAYVLLLDCVVAGNLLIRLKWNKIQTVVYFILMIYGAYKVFAMGQYVSGNYLQEFYVWQADYGVYELESYEIEGVTFYYPLQGDRTGYDSFPSAPCKMSIEFRGDGMEDGFRRL